MAAPFTDASITGGSNGFGPGGAAYAAYAAANIGSLSTLYGFSNPPTLAQLTTVLNQLAFDAPSPAGLNPTTPVSRGMVALAAWIAGQS